MTAFNHQFGYWFKCKGCGQPVGIFPDGLPPHIPPGAVGHSKPVALVGKPNSTGCALYNRLNPQEYAFLHAGEPEIEPPNSFKPVLG